MAYNIHYELAAELLLIIMLVFIYSKKNFISRGQILFRILVWSFLCNNCLGIFRGMVNNGMLSASRNAQYFLNILNILSGIFILVIYFYYVLSLIYRADPKNIWVQLGTVPSVLMGALVITTPWHHLVFFIDKSGTYQQGSWFWSVVVLFMVYLIAGALLLLLFGTGVPAWQRKMAVLLNFVVPVCVVAEQWWKLNFQILYVVLTLVLFIYSLMLQGPNYYIDDMTGLLNRNAFLEVLRENVSYRKKTWCLLLRINHYDSMLRMFEEEKLREVRRRIAVLLEEVADRKKAYRIGASTYAVLIHSEEEIQNIYQYMRSRLPHQWRVGSETISHNYSYYQVVYPDDCTDYETLIQWIHYARSDHEGHHKQGELNHLQYDTTVEVAKRRKVENLIEEAILDQRVEIHCQPVYSIEKNRITSLEVLARLRDEDKQYIDPEYFINIAEKNHTIIKLGELIFRRACIFASQNRIFEQGIEDININLSPGQCRYEHLTENLVCIAEEYGIPMERIHLEITESEFRDPVEVEQTLRRLQKTGAKVALDDFGTGCATLLSILELPLDYVKIDKSLVWSYAEGDNQFLNDLMPMIKAEGIKVIAEGIETKEHIEIFRSLGGDFLQGYYYSKPLPEREFIRFVRKFNNIE